MRKVVIERTDVKVLGVSLLYLLLGLMPIYPVIEKRLDMYTSTLDQCTGFKVDTVVVCVGLGTTGLLCAIILSYGYFLRRVIFIRGVGIAMLTFILCFAFSGFLVEPLLIVALYPFAYYVYKKTNQYKITPFGHLKFDSSVQKHD
ncbi:Hypothetical predicted protein [Mytilus galloprovincialis]|uniref:Uncharacterized protein n=1 Tax=Mytilus galloprovincialis TaxID=29158 RepID=A0A8B6GVR4_MYTGA|nr:Hypothetical predicted protein [Mytilus galloprovincialis]